MTYLKPGDICIVDKDNRMNQKLYDPLYVRIVKRYGFKKYHCVNVSSILPIYTKRFVCKDKLIIPKAYLTKVSEDEVDENYYRNVVVRIDTNTPVINDQDMTALKSIIDKTEGTAIFSKEEMKRLKVLYYKLDLYNGIRRDMYAIYNDD